MALIASVFLFDGQFGLDARLDEQRERVRDDSPHRPQHAMMSPWIMEWDAEALDDRGEHEFLGLFVLRLDRLTDRDIDELDALALPRVTYSAAGLHDVRVSDVVRWATRQPSGIAHQSATA